MRAKSFESPLLDELREWWERARGVRSAPRRCAFDPSAHVKLLPSLLMVRTAARLGDFRFTVYGTRLVEQFNDERTGRCFKDLDRFINFDEVMQPYWRVYRACEPDLLDDRRVSPERDFIAYRRLLLPLLPDSDEDSGLPSHIVGAIDFFYRDTI